MRDLKIGELVEKIKRRPRFPDPLSQKQKQILGEINSILGAKLGGSFVFSVFVVICFWVSHKGANLVSGFLNFVLKC